MPLNPESLYVQLGRLVEAMPHLGGALPITPEMRQWLARAYALVEQCGDSTDKIRFKMAMDDLYSSMRIGNAEVIYNIVYRTLATVELLAPATAQGAFIPAGSALNAFAAIGKVLADAKRDVLIVDPYMDEKTLIDFAPLASELVAIRLLTDQLHHKPTLKPAATRWVTQYGKIRPLTVRLAPARVLHDRLIALDGGEVWTLTQSLNSFATRSPASVIRVDSESAVLKRAAYEDLWQGAAPL